MTVHEWPIPTELGEPWGRTGDRRVYSLDVSGWGEQDPSARGEGTGAGVPSRELRLCAPRRSWQLPGLSSFQKPRPSLTPRPLFSSPSSFLPKWGHQQEDPKKEANSWNVPRGPWHRTLPSTYMSRPGRGGSCGDTVGGGGSTERELAGQPPLGPRGSQVSVLSARLHA